MHIYLTTYASLLFPLTIEQNFFFPVKCEIFLFGEINSHFEHSAYSLNIYSPLKLVPGRAGSWYRSNLKARGVPLGLEDIR